MHQHDDGSGRGELPAAPCARRRDITGLNLGIWFSGGEGRQAGHAYPHLHTYGGPILFFAQEGVYVVKQTKMFGWSGLKLA